MTLQQLKYLVTTAKCGSINSAAKELYISQPSLSEAIRSLEYEFGFTIFERTRQGISITDKGRELIQRANEIVLNADKLEEYFLGTAKNKPDFRVSAQHYTFATEAFMRAIKDFKANSYNFSMIETTGYKVIEDVRLGKSEVGILYFSEANKKSFSKLLNDYELSFHKLFTSKQCVMLDKDDPLANKKSLSFADLSDKTYVQFAKGEFNSSYFTEETKTIFDHNKTVNCSDRSTMFYLMKKLNGFTICTNMVHKELNGPNIVVVPLSKAGNVTVGYICSGKHTSNMGDVYIQKLKECSKEMLMI